MDMADLEEGELSDDSDSGELDLYTPLERPAVDILARPAHLNSVVDDPTPYESDSDSDDGIPTGKRMRLTCGSRATPQVPKKYTVWASNANDDIADILTSFGMDTPENDRNVENYPIPREKIERYMKRKEEFEARRRKIPVGRKFDPLAPVPVPKDLEDVDVGETSTIEEVAKEIAEKLEEPNLEIVNRIVLILGKTTAIEYFRKTREIESKGGLLILNGSRRRTSGGVFIHLIRSDKQIPGSKLVEIFEDPNILKMDKAKKNLTRSRLRKRRKGVRNPPPSPEVPSDELPDLPDRKDILAQLPDSRELLSYNGMDYPNFP